jgi:hypothetical protein
LRRKQSKEISKAGDTTSRSSLDHYDKVTILSKNSCFPFNKIRFFFLNLQHTGEFTGYFLPNYTLAPKNQGIQSSLRSTTTNHKINLVAY